MTKTGNLKPVKKGQRTKEEQREFARKGGLASGASPRKKSELRKAMQEIMEMPAPGKLKDLLASFGYAEEDQTNANAIAATLFSKAINGDNKALEMVLEYGFKVAEDERKAKESNARIEALAKNGVDISVNSGDEDGGVVIYLPKIEEENENNREG